MMRDAPQIAWPPRDSRIAAYFSRKARSGVGQGLRRGFAEASLIVAGELAEVGVACRDCGLRHGVRSVSAALDEGVPSEIETHRLE